MGKEDRGYLKHSTRCSQGIDWQKSKVVVTEKNTKQRKVRDGIEHPSTIAVTQTIGNRHSYNSYKKLKRKMVLIKRKENSKRKSPFEKNKRDVKDSKRALKTRGL